MTRQTCVFQLQMALQALLHFFYNIDTIIFSSSAPLGGSTTSCLSLLLATCLIIFYVNFRRFFNLFLTGSNLNTTFFIGVFLWEICTSDTVFEVTKRVSIFRCFEIQKKKKKKKNDWNDFSFLELFTWSHQLEIDDWKEKRRKKWWLRVNRAEISVETQLVIWLSSWEIVWGQCPESSRVREDMGWRPIGPDKTFESHM